jgi:hypothetical protein
MGQKIEDSAVELREDEVREHLLHILHSPYFRSAKRCQEFLRYIVEQTLEGQAESLRERTIGIEVFRRPNYEPAEETIVRVTANDVRKRLAQYYQEAEPDGIRIGLSPGTYTPLFTRITRPAALEVDHEPVVVTQRRKLRLISGVSAAVAVAVLAGGLYWALPRSAPLEEFWQPVLAAPHPALVWLSSGSSYLVSPRLKEELNRVPKDGAIQIQIDANDIVHVNQQISAGHVRGLLNVMLLLQRLGRPAEYRLDDPIAISELVGRPIVLIGSFNNRWAMSFNAHMRYQFGRAENPDGSVLLYVEDTEHRATRWALPPVRTSNDATYDYAIISRTFYPETKQVLITAGGIFHFGTDAAAQFITNPICWMELARKAPRGWQKKNLQVVLRSDVLRGSPNRPQIVATYFW